MTPDQIIAEAEKFFEWPSDKRDQVTYTSCLLFAEHCLKKATAWRKMEHEKPTPDGCKHGVGCLVLRPVTNGKSIEMVVDYAWYYAGQFTRQSGRTFKEDGYWDEITHWQPLPPAPEAV